MFHGWYGPKKYKTNLDEHGRRLSCVIDHRWHDFLIGRDTDGKSFGFGLIDVSWKYFALSFIPRPFRQAPKPDLTGQLVMGASMTFKLLHV